MRCRGVSYVPNVSYPFAATRVHSLGEYRLFYLILSNMQHLGFQSPVFQICQDSHGNVYTLILLTYIKGQGN